MKNLALSNLYTNEERESLIAKMLANAKELRDSLETDKTNPSSHLKMTQSLREIMNLLNVIQVRNHERPDSIFDDVLQRVERRMNRSATLIAELRSCPTWSGQRRILSALDEIHRKMRLDGDYLTMTLGGWDSLKSFSQEHQANLSHVPTKQLVAAMWWFWASHFGEADMVPFSLFCQAAATTLGLPLYMFRAKVVRPQYLHTLRYFFMYHIRARQRMRAASTKYPGNVVAAVLQQLRSCADRGKTGMRPMKVIAQRAELYSHVLIGVVGREQIYMNSVGRRIFGVKCHPWLISNLPFRFFDPATLVEHPSSKPFCTDYWQPSTTNVALVVRNDGVRITVMLSFAKVGSDVLIVGAQMPGAGRESVVPRDIMAAAGIRASDSLLLPKRVKKRKVLGSNLQIGTAHLESMTAGSSSESDDGMSDSAMEPSGQANAMVLEQLLAPVADPDSALPDPGRSTSKKKGLWTRLTGSTSLEARQKSLVDGAMRWTLDIPVSVGELRHTRTEGLTFEQLSYRRVAERYKMTMLRLRTLGPNVQITVTAAVVGPRCCGKSTLVSRLCTGVFQPDHSPTTGITVRETEKFGTTLRFAEIPSEMCYNGKLCGITRAPKSDFLIYAYDCTDAPSVQLGVIGAGGDIEKELEQVKASAKTGIVVGLKYDSFPYIGNPETLLRYRRVAAALQWPHVLVSSRTGQSIEMAVICTMIAAGLTGE
ncbi:hypothetical protein J8273_4892 [Carpediemonas membranifera]|uniref:Uncharacterized protein n=1 Tax=Carpediemonas membranifera TaxID=201153 RepID=A0A8J6E1K7_9EUKA|nr:hypothetical protein J8273_4892 [Carpediemonas membranifera]|eukprot:KAG9393593.1 hypothetical protein J8273_4892 [Carpediemonas membranifera]